MNVLAQIAVNPGSGVINAPYWGWYVILYFFLGGLAAGCYFIASMLALVGDARDRAAIRLGYLIAFPLVVVCGILLVLDLGVPLRFPHMLFRSEDLPGLIFKPWSPISVGSWVLVLFGLFSFVSFVGVLVETGRIRWKPLVRLDAFARETPGALATGWAVLGTFFGFFLAGYTGVLLIGTGHPAWHNAHFLGAVFLASAASSSYALLRLLLIGRGTPGTDSTFVKLTRADRWATAIEAITLSVMLLVLGSVARPFITGGFGAIFWIGVVMIGLLVPIVLHRRGHSGGDGRRYGMIAASCVLVGGLLLRFVIVMSPQWPAVRPWQL